jgi:hypothetical protein
MYLVIQLLNHKKFVIMKKLVIMFLAVAFIGLNQSLAQVAVVQEAVAQEAEVAVAATNNDGETEVAVADLPEAVQVALKAEDYQGWTVSKAYKVKKDGAKFYKVYLTQGDEKVKVKMHPNGELYRKAESKEKAQ